MLNKKYLMILALLILIFGISSAYANDLDNTNLTASVDDSVDFEVVTSQDNILTEQSGEIIVEDWDDLQYYCSLNDKNYVLKLKENTNYYPTNPKDNSYQIQVNNNVTILGSSGAYFGDSSPNARPINYLAIDVPDNSGYGITLKGITFKWISTEYQPDAVFLKMGGNAVNLIEDCHFTNSTLLGGHSSIIHLMRGKATLTNCTFMNIISDYGCVSIYDPKDDPTKLCTGASMEVTNSYFEGNYARTEPGCINNCGILIVRNSTFYKNAAHWWAGAIHTHGGANTTIYDSNFTDNIAGWNGGALYTYSYLQIYRTIFSGNNCTTNNGGGAIGACKYLHAPYIYVTDSLFINNENLCWAYTNESTTGLGRGGAISIMDQGGLTVLDSIFIKNSASKGTAICAIDGGENHGSPDVTIKGNTFINHTRAGDVLVIKIAYSSLCEISNNTYYNNSIEFSKLKLTAGERVGDEVTLNIAASLKNEKFYDSDILVKSGYDVYMDDKYIKTVNGTEFTLNLKNVESAQVYVVPSISNSKSNAVSVGLPKEYIYVSQKSGSNDNDGLTITTPVKTLTKACELASSKGNIIIMDGTFSETNININYNLTITGEDNVAVSSKGSIFNISNCEVAFNNIIFKNSKESVSKDRIIRQTGGSLVMNNCTFESNSYYILIESDNIVELNNLKFTKNNAILVLSDYYSIDSCIFDKNTASTTKISTLIKSDDAQKATIVSSEFSNNNVKEGCVLFKATKSLLKTLTVSDCTFSQNSGQGSASCIYIPNDGMALIKSSLFFNNTDSGSNSAVILTSSEVHVDDSIFLANTIGNSNNALINSKSSVNLKKIYCSGNWWGNTQNDYNKTPQISSSSNCDNWIFLNASANATSIFQNENALVRFNLNNVYTKDNNITYWDAGDLPTVRLHISTTGGKSTKQYETLVYGMGMTIYTLMDYEGSLIASYNGVNAIVNFTEAKINPNMNVSFNDTIFRGDDAIIVITLPHNATGNLTVDFGNISSKKDVEPKTTFNISDLPAGINYGVVTYSGDDFYAMVKQNIAVMVNKYNSTTLISVGKINVGQDVKLNFTVSPDVTGNITLSINGNETVLNLTNSMAFYTIKSITRGDYNIKATFNGNDNFLESSDETIFKVDKLITPVLIDVKDIVYGQDALIYVSLANGINGTVMVYAGDKNKSAEVKNGNAAANFSNLNSGIITVKVIFEGDNVYDPNENETAFKVSKSNTTLTINVNNIMIGSDEVIEVVVPSGVDGNVSIICGLQSIKKPIPRTGKVSWIISGLTADEYNVSATLESNNYFETSNNTNFTVFDFDVPIWPNQGYDYLNTGKSPYSTDSNGAVLWSYNLTGKSNSNIVIDSKGNVYLIANNTVYSITKGGMELWNYLSGSQGNFSGLAIGRDVIIAPESGNTLHFINQTTGIRYGSSNIYQGSSFFAPVIDSNATVYIASEYQHASEDYNLVIVPYKLWKNGGTPTLISLGKSKPSAAPVKVNDAVVVVACEDSLKIIDIKNKAIISSIKGNNNGIRPVVGPGNMIYAVIGDSIAEINPQGTIIWQTKVTDGIGSNLVLDDEIGLYLLNAKGNLYRYDIIDGTESIISDLSFTSSMLVGFDGNVYVGLNNILYAFNSDGEVLWKVGLSDTIVGAPVVGEDGNLYVSTIDKLYALSKGNLMDNDLNISVEDVNVGDDVAINITSDEYATGNLTIKIKGNSYENVSSVLNSGYIGLIVFDLDEGSYTVEVSYLGDLRYKPAKMTKGFTVNKCNSTTLISVGEITVGHDVILNFTVLPDVTGNITLSINGNETVLNLTNSMAHYTIESIASGNYTINATFNGNDKFLESSDEITFKVDKLITPVLIDVKDIVYGQDALIYVNLANGINGTVTVYAGDKNKSAEVKNGKAVANFSNLNAGNITIKVIYDGNSVYDSNKNETTFIVFKSNTTLTINVNNISVGSDEAIEVVVPGGVDGNITIKCGLENITKPIPHTGKVVWVLSNLTAGEYEVSAILESNNYFETSNNANFTVYNYTIPIWPNQGYDYSNTGKSPYSTDSNGAVLWSYNLAGKSKSNLVIDSEGNIYLIANNTIYSISRNGVELWKYSSGKEGDFSGLAIGRDVIIATESGNALHFINQTSGIRYGSSDIYQASSLFAPVIDSNANVYIAGEYQHAFEDYNLVIVPYGLWKNGGTPTMISLGNSKPSAAPVIVNDAVVAVACEDSLKIIDIKNNRIIASIGGNNNGVRPVVGLGNMIYAVIGDSIAEISPQGNIIWQTKVSGGVGSNLVLDDEMGLYLLNSRGNLYRYGLADGVESLISDLSFTSSMLVGFDGNVYVGSNNVLYAFKSDGEVLWKVGLSDTIVGAPVVGGDGNIYISTIDKLYALSKGDLIDNDLKVSVGDVKVGNDVIIKITSDEFATGNLTIKIKGDSYENVSTVPNAKNVEMLISNLSAGPYTVEVSYSGDLRYGSVNVSEEFNISKLKSRLDDIAVYGNGTFKAVLRDENGNNIANSSIIYFVNDVRYNTTTDANGQLSVETLSTCVVKIIYNGNNSVSQMEYSFTLKGITKQRVDTKILSEDFTTYTVDFYSGERGSYFTVRLVDGEGKKLANKPIKIGFNGVVRHLTTDNDGWAKLQINLVSAGTYTFAIAFLGDEDYKPSFVVNKITVNKKPTSISASAKTYKASAKTKSYTVTLKTIKGSSIDGKTYLKAGNKITLTLNGKTYTAKTNNKGQATFKLDISRKGSYSATIKFAGDNTYAASSTTKKITIK